MLEDDFTLDKDFEIIKSSKNNILFFGPEGSGKTNILNKICDLKYKKDIRYFSQTREVHYYFTNKYNNIIIDLPELNSAKNIFEFFRYQKKAWSVIPIKIICYIVRFSLRYADLIKSVSSMYKIFNIYRNNICLIISNSEESTVINKNEIELLFKTKFGINKIVFSTLNINEIQLLDKLEQFKSNIDNIHLDFNTRPLSIEFDYYLYDLDDEREKYINEFQNRLKIFSEEFSKANKKDLKRNLFLSFKDYKDNLIHKFIEIAKGKMDNIDDIIAETIIFNNEIFSEFNGFEQKYKLELDSLERDVNKFKRCPNCGIIWLIESGCQNMICGERSYIKNNRFLNYRLTEKKEKENNNVIIEKKWSGLSEEEKLKNKKRGIGKALIQPLGCGMKLQLNEMEDVYDQIPKEFKLII